MFESVLTDNITLLSSSCFGGNVCGPRYLAKF